MLASFNNHQALVNSQQHSRSVTDLHSLQGITALAESDEGAAFEQVAQQFESFLVRSLMKQMRQSVQAVSKDSYLSGPKVMFYQEMLDDQMAVTLSEQGGLGLAEQLQRQLFNEYDVETDSSQKQVDNTDRLLHRQHFPNSSEALNVGESLFSPTNSTPVKEAVGDKAVENNAGALPDRPDFSSPESFLATLYPEAERAAADLGVPPEVLLAQAALETGWGQHMIRDSRGNDSHNLFGIKADKRWQHDSVNVSTQEYLAGRPVQVKADFRRYEAYADSFSDYVRFVKEQPRYAEAVANVSNPQRYTQALQEAGYATDPQYANKIMRIVDKISATDFTDRSDG
ncbi:flagellar assembly peptidoglycan hydrolase FlgJ [bacterium]|nr:flagellar assembly peptidoglycan hydrolase FlgJ [bacterium]